MIKNMIKKYTLILGLVFLASCSTQSFNIKPTSSEPVADSYNHFFVAGIGQEQVVDAASVCGGADKVAKVEAQEGFVNILLRVFTFAIYTPRDYRVYCTQ